MKAIGVPMPVLVLMRRQPLQRTLDSLLRRFRAAPSYSLF
jgi:hypothetical protein